MTKKVEYVPVGGPCRRQCDVDKETLICQSCNMSFRVNETSSNS
jgi:predicted Fe-S protein YdhL (DUF1289 family)